MRDWTLSKIVWVADRGFSSERNRRYLRQGDQAYIIGEKLRSDSPEIKAALSRQGRYTDIAENMRVKEVKVSETERFVICHNPDGATRDAHIRGQLVAPVQAPTRPVRQARHPRPEANHRTRPRKPLTSGNTTPQRHTSDACLDALPQATPKIMTSNPPELRRTQVISCSCRARNCFLDIAVCAAPPAARRPGRRAAWAAPWAGGQGRAAAALRVEPAGRASLRWATSWKSTPQAAPPPTHQLGIAEPGRPRPRRARTT